ncbi:redox-sensing transcriptional repressor Rex [Scatolibacter rhodanostii]|uniref:redox-sensing transcriptional repressor Rex n=1 Tax=Scatolibacter rhodanostii TaxID=2014781 RepID=UPI000C06C8AC|nr:redox-sensing transcriptional repressor Rex [Scatolibacter rhodanostii]
MQKRENISMSVIRRLPRYYRFLNELQRAGISKISSKDLSEKMGLTASQIRQDFNCFGGFGQQGYGYNISHLCDEIATILGITKMHKCILIGAGNLGRSVAAHVPFQSLGFELIGIFDNKEKLFGEKIRDYTILPEDQMLSFVEREKPAMAILCVPREPTEKIVESLHSLGVHAFWNFSHYDISINYPDTIVENVHLNDSMMTLCYKLSDYSAT